MASDLHTWYTIGRVGNAAPGRGSRRSAAARKPGAVLLLAGLLLWTGGGCHRGPRIIGPPRDRPFPLGQVSDSFWETQQTNAEAADFIFYDHEFDGQTPNLTPGAKKKLMQVALRLEHVPFPVVVEESPHKAQPQLDAQRHQTVVEQLARLGVKDADKRVVLAPAFAEGFTAYEGEQAYYSVIGTFGFANGGGTGRRFGGTGGVFR